MIDGTTAPPLGIRVTSWIGLALGILAVPLGLQLALRKSATLSVTEAGVFDVRFRLERISWGAISSISVAPISHRPMIQLWLHDEKTYLARSTKLRRMFAPLNRALGNSPFPISLQFLTPGFKPVYEYIRRFAVERQDA